MNWQNFGKSELLLNFPLINRWKFDLKSEPHVNNFKKAWLNSGITYLQVTIITFFFVCLCKFSLISLISIDFPRYIVQFRPSLVLFFSIVHQMLPIRITYGDCRSCTYYDQLVLCGWCCESFIQMVQDFVDGHSYVLPTAEGLDIVLEMCELAQNIAGIMELAEEVNFFSFILNRQFFKAVSSSNTFRRRNESCINVMEKFSEMRFMVSV